MKLVFFLMGFLSLFKLWSFWDFLVLIYYYLELLGVWRLEFIKYKDITYFTMFFSTIDMIDCDWCTIKVMSTVLLVKVMLH